MAFVPMAGTRKCTSESWETSKTIFARPRGIRIFWRSTRQLPWTAGKLWMLVAQFSDFLCYFLFMTLSCSVRHVFVFWKFKCAYICIYIYTRVCVCVRCFHMLSQVPSVRTPIAAWSFEQHLVSEFANIDLLGCSWHAGNDTEFQCYFAHGYLAMIHVIVFSCCFFVVGCKL